MEVGDWGESLEGYGQLVDIVKGYYEDWNHDLQHENKIGKERTYFGIVHTFCDFDFKVRNKSETIRVSNFRPMNKKTKNKIDELLSDEKILKRYKNYKVLKKEKLGLQSAFDLILDENKMKSIQESLLNMENNGNLSLFFNDIEDYFKKEFQFNLRNEANKHPTCQIILFNKGCRFKEKKQLFSEISIYIN